jgi:TonB family protein
MAELTQLLNVRAPEMLRMLGVMEIQIVFLALLVLGAERLLRNPAPQICYALWLVVLLKSFLPPIIKMPASALPGPWVELPIISLAPAGGETQLEGLSTAGLIVALWLFTSLLLFVLAVIRYLSLRAQLRYSQPVPIDHLFSREALTLRWPPIWRNDRLATPLAFGLLRPRIYLTSPNAKLDAATQAVLYHELAHVRRHDGWIVLLQTLAQILHPFNPFVWLMNIRLSRYREQICDDFALQHAAVAPRQYGKMLLQYLETHPTSQLAFQHATCFFESKNGFQKRLTYLLSRKEAEMKRFTWKQWVLLTGLVLALIPASWQCSTKVEQPQAPAQQELTKAAESAFEAFDTPPEPVGGFKALQQNLHYPEIAKKAGIQGIVLLEVLINERGQVTEASVVKTPAEKAGINEAAINAIKTISWKPALKDGRPVSVRVSIPVKFKLEGDKVEEGAPPPPPPEGN